MSWNKAGVPPATVQLLRHEGGGAKITRQGRRADLSAMYRRRQMLGTCLDAKWYPVLKESVRCAFRRSANA
jgi:hypothetical protein